MTRALLALTSLAVFLLQGCQNLPTKFPLKDLSIEKRHDNTETQPEIISIDHWVLKIFSMRSGDVLRFQMPNGKIIAIQTDEIEHKDSAYIWTGRILNDHFMQRAFFVLRDGQVLGSIEIGDAYYEVVGDQSQLFAQERNTDQRLIFSEADPDGATPPNTTARFYEPENNHPPDHTIVTINVLLLPTKELLNKLGPVQLANRMDLIKKKAFQSFIDSKIYIQLGFPDIQSSSIDIAANNSNSAVLEMITPIVGKDTYITRQIHYLRRKNQTNLVSIVRSKPSGGNCGIGWVVGERPLEDENFIDFTNLHTYGYSVVNIDPQCDDLTLAHEIGHNLGSEHDRITHGDNPKRGAFPSSFGYIGRSASNGFTTIMGYADAQHPRVGIYSNTVVTSPCFGAACGIGAGPEGADNRAGFNAVRYKVSNWRYFRDFFVAIKGGRGRIEGRFTDGQNPGFPDISCPAACFSSIPDGREITLRAIPEPGYKFQGWQMGTCPDPEQPCVMRAQDTRDIDAYFYRVSSNRADQENN